MFLDMGEGPIKQIKRLKELVKDTQETVSETRALIAELKTRLHEEGYPIEPGEEDQKTEL